MEAEIRTLRSRITLWKAGRFSDLWKHFYEYKLRSLAEQRQDDNKAQREGKWVTRLVNLGLLLCTASLLFSCTPLHSETLANLFSKGNFPFESLKQDTPLLRSN